MNKLQIGPVRKVDATIIVPVEQLTVHSETNSHACWWYGSKELYALVITTPSEFKVYDKYAQELNMDEIIREIPELTEYL